MQDFKQRIRSAKIQKVTFETVMLQIDRYGRRIKLTIFLSITTCLGSMKFQHSEMSVIIEIQLLN